MLFFPCGDMRWTLKGRWFGPRQAKRVTFAAACMGWDAIFVVNLRPSELGKYHVMMQVDMHPVSFSDTATLL